MSDTRQGKSRKADDSVPLELEPGTVCEEWEKNDFKWSEWKPVTRAVAQTSGRRPAALLTIFRGHRAGSGLTESSVPGTECGGVDSALKISLACGLRRGMVAVSFPLKDFIATFPEALLCVSLTVPLRVSLTSGASHRGRESASFSLTPAMASSPGLSVTVPSVTK